MNDRAPLVFVIAAFSFWTLFPDFIGTILAGIFYGLGKDQECSINAKAYLLAYIIVKVFLILCRLFSIGIGLILRNIGGVVIHLLSFFSFYRRKNEKISSIYKFKNNLKWYQS